MPTDTARSEIPPLAELVAPRDHLSFYDSQGIDLTAPLSPGAAWNAIMAHQIPGMALAFRVRDAIAAPFGVKRIGGLSGRPTGHPEVGGMLDFFRVETSTDQVLTLTERDRHLDVMTCITIVDQRLSITSSVMTHNLFGQAYMIPVAPAHRVIVGRMLRGLARDQAKLPSTTHR